MIASLTSLAVAAGITYGLWRLIRRQDPQDACTQHRPVVVMDGTLDYCERCDQVINR